MAGAARRSTGSRQAAACAAPRREMRSRETTKNSYKLNAKGKIVVALYAVAVMVILALIVLNTGVLASLKSGNSALVENITELSGQYEELVDRIETVSSDDYVKDIAENVYNMIKR